MSTEISKAYAKGVHDQYVVDRVIIDDLVAALDALREQIRAHFKLDVKKHYSLMVAEAAAGSALRKAKGEA